MNSNPIHARSNLWAWTAFIWLGFGLADAAQTVIVLREQGTHHAWFKLFVVTALFWLPWALATVPVIHLGRRFPPLHVRPVFTWIVHLGACLTISVVFTVWTT